MKIQARDKAGNLLFNDDGSPIMIEVDGKELAEYKAEQAARAKAEAEAKKRADDVSRLEAELARRDKEKEDLRVAALPVQEQMNERMKQIDHQLAQERAERARMATEYQQGFRSLELVAYRERAVRDVPPQVARFVRGNSEEEIDQSVDHAKRLYDELVAELKAKVQAETAPSAPAQAPILYAQPVPPPNPAYVAFPTVTNPLPVTESTVQPLSIRELTSEEAVRRGRYSGELREQLLAQVRGVPYQGSVGSAPRQWNQVPHQQLPNGVMQPAGLPTPQPAPPQYQQPQYQQPQYTPPPQVLAPMPQFQQQAPQYQQPVSSPAAEAVARTHNGANPVLAANPGAAEALRTAQQYAQTHGIQSPAAAFQTRFQNTPPAGN